MNEFYFLCKVKFERKTKSHKGKSACKRMHLMLRWLVRKDGNVDLGVWRRIP